MSDYSEARPNTAKLMEYLNEYAECINWKAFANDLIDFMSDDDVGDFIRINGYWKEDDDE